MHKWIYCWIPCLLAEWSDTLHAAWYEMCFCVWLTEAFLLSVPAARLSFSSWPLELCSPAWCLGLAAPPASTWWSFVPARWPWRAARWPLTSAKVRSTSSRPTTPSSTSAGRTGPPGTWMMWVTLWACDTGLTCVWPFSTWLFSCADFRTWSSSPMTASSNGWTSAPLGGFMCWSSKPAPKDSSSGCRYAAG